MSINLRRWFWSILLGGALLGVSATTWTSAKAQDEAPNHLPAMYRCAQSFAASLSSGDTSSLASVAQPSLVARVRVPAEAAKRRTYECLGLGPVMAPNVGPVYGTALLLARQPDGVEDVVTVTLKFDAGQWRVVGGPVGHTRSNPLDD